jgi:Helix-turn-helix domain
LAPAHHLAHCMDRHLTSRRCLSDSLASSIATKTARFRCDSPRGQGGHWDGGTECDGGPHRRLGQGEIAWKRPGRSVTDFSPVTALLPLTDLAKWLIVRTLDWRYQCYRFLTTKLPSYKKKRSVSSFSLNTSSIFLVTSVTNYKPLITNSLAKVSFGNKSVTPSESVAHFSFILSTLIGLRFFTICLSIRKFMKNGRLGEQPSPKGMRTFDLATTEGGKRKNVCLNTRVGHKAKQMLHPLLKIEVETPQDFARSVGVSDQCVIRWIRTNRIAAHRIGGRLFIPVAELIRLKEESSNIQSTAVQA